MTASSVNLHIINSQNKCILLHWSSSAYFCIHYIFRFSLRSTAERWSCLKVEMFAEINCRSVIFRAYLVNKFYGGNFAGISRELTIYGFRKISIELIFDLRKWKKNMKCFPWFNKGNHCYKIKLSLNFNRTLVHFCLECTNLLYHNA